MEVQALDAILDDAIVRSKIEDDGDPVFHEVPVRGVNPFVDEDVQSEVYTSLAMKGLIACSGTPEEDGGARLEFVCITPAGMQALKEAKGVH